MKDIKKLKKDDFIKYFDEVNKEELKPILIEATKHFKLNDFRKLFKITHMNTKTGKTLKAIEGVNCMDCFTEMRNDEHSSINKNYCRECLDYESN